MASGINLGIFSKFDDKGVKDAQNGLDDLGRLAKNAGIAVAAGLAVAATATVAFGVASLKAAAEAEAVTRGLENAAKNAGVFGDSSMSITKATDALDKHSKKLGELTGIDDELINQLKTGWLAVPDLAAKGTDGINKLAVAAADIAKGTGKDISAVAMAFTKISGDSETALSKLNRIGIVLSDQQKQTYEDILATNGEIAAQDYLITTLGDKYKGAAEAAANPFERLDVIFGNLKETIGAALLPAFESLVPQLQSFIEKLVASPEFNQFLADMATNFQGILNWLPGVFDYMLKFGNEALPVVNAFFPALNDALYALGSAFGGIEDTDPSSTTTKFAGALNGLAGALTAVGDAFKWIGDTINNVNKFYAGLPNWLKVALPLTGAGWLQTLEQMGNAMQRGNLTGWAGSTNVNFGSTPSTPRGRLVGQANGGVTVKPGLSVIGEDGPEIMAMPRGAGVIPLDRIVSSDSKQAGATYNISVTAGMGTDGAALGEQIVNAIRRYERTSGAVFARA